MQLLMTYYLTKLFEVRLSSVERYSIKDKRWTVVASMNMERQAPGVLVLHGIDNIF